MKRNEKKGNFLKENGLVIGLYSVVGILVVSAGVLTVQNFSMAENLIVGDDMVQEGNILEDSSNLLTEEVSNDTSVSYKDKEMGDIGIAVSSNVPNEIVQTKEKKTNIEEIKPDENKNIETSETKEEPPKENENDSNENDLGYNLTNKDENKDENEDENDLKNTDETKFKPIDINENEEEKELDEENKNLSKNDEEEEIEKKDTSENTEDEDEKNEDENDLTEDKDEDTENEDDSEPAMKTIVEESIQTNNVSLFTAFDDNSSMTWPVVGEVIMPYSEDFILDITLDQYRTNDTVRIEANVGSKVEASFSGEVVKVGNTYEDGHFIVLSHGNGWSSTYTQLDKNLLVSEGDVVDNGQVLGYVANPTRRYSALDTHLGFRVEKDDTSVNPQLVLAD